MTTTNGLGNRTHSSCQSKAVARRCKDDYVGSNLQHTKTAIATNTRSKARTHIDSTTHPDESDIWSRYSGQSDQKKREVQKKKEQVCLKYDRIGPGMLS